MEEESIARTVRIACGVLGYADTFHVDTPLNVSVGDLKKKLVQEWTGDPSYALGPKDVTLFVTRKGDGTWLKEDDDEFTSILLGTVQKPFPIMLGTSPLFKDTNLGSSFKYAYGDHHVLARIDLRHEQSHETSQAPEFEHMMNVEPSYEEITQAYRETAERLKNHDKVKQVIAAINQITKYRVEELTSRIVQEDMPFIVLESSSGTGKTQMAFNLMAHEDLEVYYLVHDQQPIRQKVYSAVATRSNTFKKCVKKDMPYIDDGAIVAISSMGSLYTFAFIWALLTGASSVSGGKTRSEVEEALRSKTESGKIVVVFLDKFPALGNQEDERKVFMLRFIQNVFRAFGIVVIMSATNGTARNLITTGSHSRSDSKALWCIMFPSLPSFQDPSVELIPSELQRLVRHSRPLFAHLALKQLGSDQLPGEKEELIEYLNILMGSLADQFGGWKEHWPDWFRTGQVCLFLCGCYVVDRKSGLLHGHFARLAEDEPFELMVGKKDLTKNDETGQWECRTMFPPVYEDALLYLTLTGGKYYNPLVDATGDPIPFHTALSEVPASFVRFDNDKQLSEDGMRLESIVGASLVVASHQDGFGGSAFPSFFLRFLFELGILESRDATVSLPKLPLMYESPTNRCVPFLAPPNQVWPNTSANELLQLGTLRRVRNEERIDFCFMGGEVTVECKDYSDPPNVKVIKDILDRVPEASRIHLVVTNTLQASYFNTESFDTFMKADPKLPAEGSKSLKPPRAGSLRHARIYKMSANDRSFSEITMMENKCHGENCRPDCDQLDKVILFLLRGSRGNGQKEDGKAPPKKRKTAQSEDSVMASL
ncbi:hypothetical protein Poli38472_002946 [Pythium oligandrum]|uniref:Crinkler (CRN) family protein n=1 Tax=Pythium oligandrum TaxID=41045 RepID=A0A8K1C5M2_PYTOL|nr:hypothetical protein Poli38472_002946 [Pythium oligandrum]|eukprot:TMW57021.1 hypothetical protein Poli38472_002946 [Pythium oligandrum]